MTLPPIRLKTPIPLRLESFWYGFVSATTPPAKKIHWRPVDGIVVLDKPPGVSSNAALQQVRRIFAAEKGGHTGALDPFATGVLPICLGEATKVSQFLLDADKTYAVKAKLGVRTNTGDIDGEVLAERPVEELTQQQVFAVLNSFLGQSEQIPSMFSALKHKGRPLYELARQGKEVERKAREITVYSLEQLHLDGDTLSFVTSVSKGTYIRNLVDDLGEKLGCGAHVSYLRRIQSGPFSRMVTLEMLELAREKGTLNDLLLPISAALTGFAEVELDDVHTQRFQFGQRFRVPHSAGMVIVYGPERRLLGIAEVLADGLLVAHRLMKTN